jgi:hypothetical protein
VYVTPAAVDGPEFPYVTVPFTVFPAVADAGTDTDVDTSATAVTVSVSVALLFPGVGSVVPPGTAMVATFETLPLVAVTSAVTVIW